MKKALQIAITACFAHLAFFANSQCLTTDVDIEKRISHASLIIDGEVIEKTSFELDGMIYTQNKIKILQKFKGQLNGLKEIVLITLGGQVGDHGLEVTPSLQVQKGAYGLFFLKNWTKDANAYEAVFDGMGMVRYDFYTHIAEDLFTDYGNIKNTFLPLILRSLGENNKETFATPFYEQTKIDRRATPNITFLSPSVIAAGNDQALTIDGSNFGATQGTGKVQFEDGNDGGSTWTDAVEYKSWSDIKIEVYVPSRAGTGNVRVINTTNELRVSAQSITVPYAMLNAVFTDEPDNPYFTKLNEDNSSTNQFVWQYNNRFGDSADAKAAFEISMETWRCGTFIPFNVNPIATNFSNYEANDGVNLVTWDHGVALPSNVLGRCYSRWLSCGNTGSRTTYVSELDIVFNISRLWHYGSSNASGGKMDFVSVCAHELGHGHQLGHVIDANKMMHFSIGANQTKRGLSAGDKDGGDLVMNRSVVRTCNRDALVALNVANCALNATIPDFTVSSTNPCLEEQISFEDNSNGVATGWTWNFGANAIPASASGIGPHNVSYLVGGAKNVSLTVLSPAGNVMATKNSIVNVKMDKRVGTKIIFSNYGNNVFKFYAENGAGLGKSWLYNSGRDSIVNVDTIYIAYPAPGSYTLQLRAKNSCNDTLLTVNLTDWINISLIKENQITVYPNPASKSITIQGNGIAFDQLSISDLTGKTIIKIPFEAQKPIDVSKLSKGIYLLSLMKNDALISTKLVIE